MIKDNISINEMGAVINVEELTSVLKISINGKDCCVYWTINILNEVGHMYFL